MKKNLIVLLTDYLLQRQRKQCRRLWKKENLILPDLNKRTHNKIFIKSFVTIWQRVSGLGNNILYYFN